MSGGLLGKDTTALPSVLHIWSVGNPHAPFPPTSPENADRSCIAPLLCSSQPSLLPIRLLGKRTWSPACCAPNCRNTFSSLMSQVMRKMRPTDKSLKQGPLSRKRQNQDLDSMPTTHPLCCPSCGDKWKNSSPASCPLQQTGKADVGCHEGGNLGQGECQDPLLRLSSLFSTYYFM